MLTTTERALTPAEVQSVAGRLRRARRERLEAQITAFGPSLLIGGVLGRFTFHGPWLDSWSSVLLWMLFTMTLALLLSQSSLSKLRYHVESLDEARRASRVKIMRVQSSRVVEFEEKENEAACYAFEIDATTCLFIVGQEFHRDDFPNTDFSIVNLLGMHGRPVDTTLEMSGRKLTPERVITPSVSRLVEIPEHVTTVEAAIDSVEHALGKPTGRGYA